MCVGERDDPNCLSDADIAPETTAAESVAISKLHSLQGVNALVTGQALDFAKDGITIIYGDNGSGKSGYCRVLKHACRSRDNKFHIHPNIDGPSDAPQSASIDFSVGAVSKTAAWAPDGSEISELSKVSIFDSRSANTHVQAENSVAYTPFPMRVLERLGELCDTLKEKVEGRIKAIDAKTPIAIANHQFGDDTSAGKFLTALSAKSDPEVLELLCALSEDEARRLETLKQDLSQDPQKVLKNLTAQKDRVEKIVLAIQGLRDATSAEMRSKHRDLSQALSNARAASKTASEELFKASPLPEIGSDIWKSLWEAARTFSDDVAYLDKTFPEASPGDDLCVLCQQPLDETAVARMMTFENFIKGSTKAQENTCRQNLETSSATLEKHKVPDEALSAMSTFVSDELGNPEIAQSISAWVSGSNGRLARLLANEDDEPFDAELPITVVTALKDEFSTRIDQLQSVKDPAARAKLDHEKRDLEARGGLVAIKEDILAQIERLKEIARLRKVLKTTSRTPVTNKNKELSELLVTGALRSRFAREIAKLELNAAPMELHKTGARRAQSFFQVGFVKFPGQPLGEILSEGEHRCVALAAFLAELVTSRDYSGIVFDDPMSSLDHIYRERVARRLAEEAEHRQVVIFTHDLGFLFEVSRETQALKVPLHYQHVRRRGETPGYIFPELPMKAKTAPALVSAMRQSLKNKKGQFDNMPEMERVIYCKGMIAKLRETWEQVIADFLSPVLGRFDNKVKGNSFFKLLKLTSADVEIANGARSRLSEDLHNVAEDLNPAEVTHDQISKEVDVIHDFIKSMANRPDPT